MRYTSTRNNDIDCSFEEAITSGYASDGGLFVPRTLPTITTSMLASWAPLTYPQLMQHVVRLFVSIDEVTDTELQNICEAALQGFVHPNHAVPIVPLVPVPTDDEDKVSNANATTSTTNSFYVSELFHGPTFCFKDLGMRAVIQLLSLFAQKRQQCITLIVSTTGDTGPAAVQAVADLPSSSHNIKIVVHYPYDQISDFQRKQMTTIVSPQHVHVVAFHGGGDDMDIPIKRLLASQRDKTETSSGASIWTGVNSYNIGRPIMQLVLYIWTYLRIAEEKQWTLDDTPDDELSTSNSSVDRSIDIILPTGAMGNIAAGYMARQMGLPIGRLVAAVNINDITHTAFTLGAFHRSPIMHRTLSEAINIQVPYNFERLIYYLTDRNDTLVKEWYDGMAVTGQIDLDQTWIKKLQSIFQSARVTDEQMCAAAAAVYSDYSYIADPNTAVAFSAAYQLGYLQRRRRRGQESGSEGISNNSNSSETVNIVHKSPVTVLLATASPCKFESPVRTSLGDQVWDSYRASDAFPAAAQHMLNLPEQPLTVYPTQEGRTLEDTQLDWERRARDVVARLECHEARV